MIGELKLKCVEEPRDIMRVYQCDDDLYIRMELASGTQASIYLDVGQAVDLANHLNNYLIGVAPR